MATHKSADLLALRDGTAAMATAARAWLTSLSDTERAAACCPFTESAHHNWHYLPRADFDETRPGLRIDRQPDAALAPLWTLLDTVLSRRGRERVEGIILLEGILAALEQDPTYHDAGGYALTVLGEPGEGAPWGWRFEGHHLSLNVTVVPGEGVAVTPCFVGAHPARVPDGHPHAGLRLLGAEEDDAFSLVQALDAPLRERVMIAGRALADIVSGPGREQQLRQPQGLPLSALPEGARDRVYAIAERYAGTMHDAIARASIQKLREPGPEALFFAWAGGLRPGEPHYFRIHGPRTLIEYDNSQDGANHVHSVWHDPQNVFGSDLLAEHHAHAHTR